VSRSSQPAARSAAIVGRQPASCSWARVRLASSGAFGGEPQIGDLPSIAPAICLPRRGDRARQETSRDRYGRHQRPAPYGGIPPLLPKLVGSARFIKRAVLRLRVLANTTFVTPVGVSVKAMAQWGRRSNKGGCYGRTESDIAEIDPVVGQQLSGRSRQPLCTGLPSATKPRLAHFKKSMASLMRLWTRLPTGSLRPGISCRPRRCRRAGKPVTEMMRHVDSL
jgi:hypothetical protein